MQRVVELSAPDTQVVTVTITGPVYRAGDMDVSTQVLTFQPGQTTANFRVAITDDQIYEGDEVFGYEITSATNAQINMAVENGADVRKLIGYIIDNDVAQGPTVRFSSPSGVVNVSESAGFLERPVHLSAASNQIVTVTITGPAYRAGDMDVSTQVLTFQPGQTMATFRAAITDDQTYEGDEVFGYEITSATNAQINMAVENGADVRKLIGYIIDNDVAQGPTVRFSSPSGVVNVSESAGFLERPVHLSAASNQIVTVTITGPAYRAGDMDVSTQVLTFQPGQTTATFRVAINDDKTYEGDEVFGYEITSATNAQINMAVENGADVRKLIGYIIDNDTISSPAALSAAVSSILRGANEVIVSSLIGKVLSGSLTSVSAITEIVKAADATTSVATMAYQFFTGKIPSQLGVDYLVSPTGPNANNLNSAYYQTFNLENRYINFAVNLGKIGEGKDAFAAKYGTLSFFDATREAYKTIFGAAPTDAKIHILIDTRVSYFAAYGGDGPEGQGTKAAMVGWLLAEAEKADLGVMARSNAAWLTDLADGSAPFAVNILDPAAGYYKADFIFGGA